MQIEQLRLPAEKAVPGQGGVLQKRGVGCQEPDLPAALLLVLPAQRPQGVHAQPVVPEHGHGGIAHGCTRRRIQRHHRQKIRRAERDEFRFDVHILPLRLKDVLQLLADRPGDTLIVLKHAQERLGAVSQRCIGILPPREEALEQLFLMEQRIAGNARAQLSGVFVVNLQLVVAVAQIGKVTAAHAVVPPDHLAIGQGAELVRYDILPEAQQGLPLPLLFADDPVRIHREIVVHQQPVYAFEGKRDSLHLSQHLSQNMTA